jgi:aspartate racemase
MIGVVAGVGPFAGLDLLHKILSQTIASRDQDHLTVISISQPDQIPDRTEFLLGQSLTNPAIAILEQLLKLEKMGAQVAGIPCNTAHAPAIFSEIQKGLDEAGSRLNLLHMIAEVGHELRRQSPSIYKVGILATAGTIVSSIYPLNLQPLGFELLVPDEKLQAERIHPAIYDPEYGIKAHGQSTDQARSNLMLGIQQLREAGAQAVILGCTEIPLAIPEKQIAHMPVIDPALILARALISAVNPQKLKPPARI